MQRQPIRRLKPSARAAPVGAARAEMVEGPTSWPLTVPAVAQIATQGLDLPPGATILMGENGAGKSTVIEVLAAVLGLNPEGGSAGTRHRTRASEPGHLDLVVERSPGAPRWAYYLRDETLHGLYTYLEEHPSPRPEPRFHQLSHGEAFLQILAARASTGGFYLMDEPDAALSFQGSLSLVALLSDLVATGAQTVIATHSPIVAALPDAHLLEIGPRGLRTTTWEQLDITTNWREFLRDPQSYLRHPS